MSEKSTEIHSPGDILTEPGMFIYVVLLYIVAEVASLISILKNCVCWIIYKLYSLSVVYHNILKTTKDTEAGNISN